MSDKIEVELNQKLALLHNVKRFYCKARYLIGYACNPHNYNSVKRLLELEPEEYRKEYSAMDRPICGLVRAGAGIPMYKLFLSYVDEKPKKPFMCGRRDDLSAVTIYYQIAFARGSVEDMIFFKSLGATIASSETYTLLLNNNMFHTKAKLHYLETVNKLFLKEYASSLFLALGNHKSPRYKFCREVEIIHRRIGIKHAQFMTIQHCNQIQMMKQVLQVKENSWFFATIESEKFFDAQSFFNFNKCPYPLSSVTQT